MLADPDGGGNNPFGAPPVSELLIDYDRLFVLESGTTLSWFLNASCSERSLVQGHVISEEGVPTVSSNHVYEVDNGSSIVIGSENYTTSGGEIVDYRLVSLNEDGGNCPDTRQAYYYRLNGNVD